MVSKRVLVIHPQQGEETSTLSLLGQEIEVRRLGCGADPARARRWIAEHDGRVDAIALEAMPVRLELGPARRSHGDGTSLAEAAAVTPVVDGSGVRGGLERWGVILAERAEPGIFNEKRVLMVPGLNHGGLAQALGRRGAALRYADPLIYFGLPDLPGMGSSQTLAAVAPRTLDLLRSMSFDRLQAGVPTPRGSDAPFRWADVLAGDALAIRRHAPSGLAGKTVVIEHAGEEDLDDLRRRGVSIAVSLMPSLGEVGEDGGSAGWSAAAVEAILAALRQDAAEPLSEDTYLNLMAQLEWTPAIRYLQPQDAGVHRFAFVVHPLDVSYIHKHPSFRWTRWLPDALVESVSAWMPPLYISRIVGGRSPATDQRIEGHLISLCATPRQMLAHPERFTYDRLNRAARMAERLGCRILGLGAFTSVVGDAGVTVAHESRIAITSGNSLTVAATLEAAKQALRAMGKEDLTRGRAMVIGATGSIGSVCARLLAQAIREVVLVSIEPEKLIDLKRLIESETPGARITIATRSGDLAADCDLIITATSAFGQRVLDISRVKPGAVVCDVARPCDIGAEEAALRPDVLVIESGEVLIPGALDFGYDIGLPPGTAYACLAETALLAMEGRFESFTLGREIEVDRVKEIYRLFRKHGFRIAGLRSFDRFVTEEELARKRELAERLKSDPEELGRLQQEVERRLELIPPRSKGVRPRHGPAARAAWVGAATGLVALVALARHRRGARG